MSEKSEEETESVLALIEKEVSTSVEKTPKSGRVRMKSLKDYLLNSYVAKTDSVVPSSPVPSPEPALAKSKTSTFFKLPQKSPNQEARENIEEMKGKKDALLIQNRRKTHLKRNFQPKLLASLVKTMKKKNENMSDVLHA